MKLGLIGWARRFREPEAPDLHGHAKQPFPNFSEDCTYLEAVNFPTHSQAKRFLVEQGYGDPGGDRLLGAIFMRFGLPEDTKQEEDIYGWGIVDHGEPVWWECEKSHPDAIPFWKDGDDDVEVSGNARWRFTDG